MGHPNGSWRNAHEDWEKGTATGRVMKLFDEMPERQSKKDYWQFQLGDVWHEALLKGGSVEPLGLGSSTLLLKLNPHLSVGLGYL